MQKITLPKFESKSDLFKYLQENKATIIAQKKAITKWADPVSLYPTTIADKGEVSIKENEPLTDVGDELKVKVVINTTNLMDGHDDVHLPGLWKKSLNENKLIMHLQEHKSDFDKVISDGVDLKAFTQGFTWSELGQDFKGSTEALVFESNIRKSRNEFMQGQYAQGFVKQHSVGMRYIQLGLALNDTSISNASEFEAWEKYFPEIANADVAEEKGFFWFVKEAKAIEGSAVLRGSNWVTPTLDNNVKTLEPPKSTQTEPEESTQNKESRRRYI